MFKVYWEEQYEGAWTIAEFDTLEQARTYAQDILAGKNPDQEPPGWGEAIGIKVEYSVDG